MARPGERQPDPTPASNSGRFWLILVLLLALAGLAEAHDPGLSTATLRIDAATVEVALTFALADAENLRLPGQHPGEKLTPAETAIRRAQLGSLVVSNFLLELNDRAANPVAPLVQFDAKNNVAIQWSVPRQAAFKLSGQSKLIEFLPRGHRQFLSVRDARGKPLLETLLSAQMEVWSVDLPGLAQNAVAATRPTSFLSFLRLGIGHILTGYDHLLFLLGLLVVVPNFLSAVKVVSCFTLAHSVTLAMATFGLVQLRSAAVEPLIAATIVYVGVENLLVREVPKRRWLLTLGFGLVHGFGFATALRERGVGSGETGILVPLLSFNLGVELGQIAVAALLLPAIWALKQRPAFTHRLVPGCSVGVALLGGYWLIARTLGSWE